MKQLLEWLDDRTGIRRLTHEALYENIPGGSRWKFVWGSTLVFAFAMQVITGTVLWMAYSPSGQTAWESVFYIQNVMPGGALLRSLHHYMAQAMVVLLALHLMQVVICGAYRAPREINFWLGMILMQIVLGLSLTGYLLPWDQKGYWATGVATNIMGLTGDAAQRLAVGGGQYGHHTLTRFFAMHAGVLPGLLIFFVVLHIAIFRKHGIHATNPEGRPDEAFWPDQVLKDGVACLAVLAVVLGLALWRPAELTAPADPSAPFDAARPEWYFLFLFQLLKYFPGDQTFIGQSLEFWGAIIVPGAVMGVLALMPIVGRWRLGHAFNLCFLACLMLGISLLTAQAFYEDHHASWSPKDAAKFADAAQQKKYEAAWDASKQHITALEHAQRDAERARDLALAPAGIPPEGMISIMRRDPLTQGPRLFAAKCAGCHSATREDDSASIVCPTPTAPNLGGFGSRSWIRGLLDPTKIVGPAYFGNSPHLKSGEMVTWVTDTVTEMDAEAKANLDKLVIALSAEAQSPTQREQDEKDAETIAAGRTFLSEEVGCVDCHKFHDAGEEGLAPDLTGYASREWLIGMIGNPNHVRFYGHVDAVDQPMPAFAPSPDRPEANQLSAEEVGLIADWLRGDWYRAPASESAR
ncbi:MAG: cytochrome b N-terminal domain-containing protein [Planctomycetia bacterium]|nr:cytochrome b N-terminal domain-containing protein [Planctomycetia bacterium]